MHQSIYHSNVNLTNMININNSILFDNQQVTNIKNNYKPIYQWVSDDAIKTCYYCNTEFTFLIRKHHCRICGRIFCYKCSNNWREIPKNISIPAKNLNLKNSFNLKNQFNTWFYKNQERVCICCDKLIQDKTDIDVLLLVFRFLNIRDVKFVMLTSKKWYKAGLQYLTILRSIQYKNFMQPITDYERDILHANMLYYTQHSKWIFTLIQFGFYDIFKLITCNKNTNCKNIICKSGCSPTLDNLDIIQLLANNSINIQIKLFLLQQLNKITDTELKICSPLFINQIAHNPAVFLFLSDYLQNNPALKFYYDWEFIRSNIIINNQINQQINIQVKNLYYSLQHMNFININNYQEQIKKSFGNGRIPYLFDMTSEIISVFYSQITPIHSKTMPILIPLKIKTKNGFVQHKKILFKKDNILQDFIICKIIKLINFILKQERIIHNEYISYDIILLTNYSGFIEIVDNAETIYNIQNKYKTSILNYILDNNPENTINFIRENFMTSLAVYSVITYLLGIGDRHLNNIMIHKNGSIFHIDFGYILGNDPKINMTPIRLSDSMIEVIGGKTSQNYQSFRDKCSKIFNCLRNHMGIISMLLHVLTLNNPILTQEKLIHELIQRFEPGEKYLDAEQHMMTIIDNSHDNMTATFFDFIYKYKNLWTNK